MSNYFIYRKELCDKNNDIKFTSFFADDLAIGKIQKIKHRTNSDIKLKGGIAATKQLIDPLIISVEKGIENQWELEVDYKILTGVSKPTCSIEKQFYNLKRRWFE